MSGKGGSGGADEHCQCFIFGMVVCMVVNSRLRPLIPNWCAVQQHPLTSIDHQFAKKKLTYSQSCVCYIGYTLYHGTMVVITGELGGILRDFIPEKCFGHRKHSKIVMTIGYGYVTI